MRTRRVAEREVGPTWKWKAYLLRQKTIDNYFIMLDSDNYDELINPRTMLKNIRTVIPEVVQH